MMNNFFSRNGKEREKMIKKMREKDFRRRIKRGKGERILVEKGKE